MDSRPKIAIVAGELPQPRFLALFEALREAFDVCVYVLHHDRLLDRHGTGLKLRIFENLPDMPGYMRGLEEELAGVNLIIGVETSRLATFQAVRAARKYGAPFSVIVSEHLPFFYERFANIRAIQFDIINKAERFWATSRAAAANLKLDSVANDMIALMPPVVDVARFRPNPAGRQKFRDYVGIGAQDVVVLFPNELEPYNRPEELVKALSLVKKQLGPKAANLRLMFAGTGSSTMDLKYRAYDLGLGKSAMFLHQDSEPFLADLYTASDIIMLPRPLKTEFHDELPLRLLEAMASGVFPLVGAGTLAAELASGVGSIFSDDTHQSLAARLSELLLYPEALLAGQGQAVAHTRAEHAAAVVGPRFIEDIENVLAAIQSAGARRQPLETLRTAIENDLGRGAERDALVRVEEALLLDVPTIHDKADLIRCKGDAHYALGDIETAMAAYSEALKLDDRNVACLRGLGYVAWQGHSNEEALTFFKKALAIRGDDAQSMLGIGLVYRRLGLSEEAIFWLERCAVGFSMAPAVVALAQTCAQLSRVSFGIEVLERVIDAMGDNHTLMMTLGQLYLTDGRIAEGHAMLQKALAGGDSPAA